VLGALTLLTITIYLRQVGSNYWYTLLPMAFMMGMTITAMVLDLQTYWEGGQMLLVFVATSIFVLSLWLVAEAYLRFRKDALTQAQVPASQPEGD
jgi:carbon starvation protein